MLRHSVRLFSPVAKTLALDQRLISFSSTLMRTELTPEASITRIGPNIGARRGVAWIRRAAYLAYRAGLLVELGRKFISLACLNALASHEFGIQLQAAACSFSKLVPGADLS